MLSDHSCVNQTETVHGTFRFLFDSFDHELVYFKELHNDQEYYWPTIYRGGGAVLSTITRKDFLFEGGG